EIAASRRLYNSQVTEFNQKLFAFPTNVPASKMRLSTIPLYQASELQRKDVEIKF
ncbi:LemA family protein, partial [Mycoplasmopsis pullorum]